jgi:hypothetical protein
VLGHAGEGLVVLFGFWRFVCSATYRQRKIEEWRQTGEGRATAPQPVYAGGTGLANLAAGIVGLI